MLTAEELKEMKECLEGKLRRIIAMNGFQSEHKIKKVSRSYILCEDGDIIPWNAISTISFPR